MPVPEIEKTIIGTLKEFYDLMAATREVRAATVEDILNHGAVRNRDILSLRNARATLGALPDAGGGKALAFCDGGELVADLSYEISELDKDILYLEEGRQALIEHLRSLHPGFDRELERLRPLLSGTTFNVFLTDRDGTVNNYCGRYRSSVQSAYNAVFLSVFAEYMVLTPVIISSAPLSNPGLVDVCTMPPGKYILAASKGREFLDLGGLRYALTIQEEKQALLDRLNRELSALVAKPEYENFTLIGSGLQFKFGQTTVARQDIGGSIPEAESAAFLENIRRLVARLDPEGRNFRIEDTGLDIEIILTIEGSTGVKDFDKGDAVRFLDETAPLRLEHGPNLVCGDTASDLPMLAAVMEKCPDTMAVFVTTDETLIRRARKICPSLEAVSSPDILVAALVIFAQAPYQAHPLQFPH